MARLTHIKNIFRNFFRYSCCGYYRSTNSSIYSFYSISNFNLQRLKSNQKRLKSEVNFVNTDGSRVFQEKHFYLCIFSGWNNTPTTESSLQKMNDFSFGNGVPRPTKNQALPPVACPRSSRSCRKFADNSGIWQGNNSRFHLNYSKSDNLENNQFFLPRPHDIKKLSRSGSNQTSLTWLHRSNTT